MDNIKTIIEAIRKGYNPVTGESFDASILSSDPQISKEILKLALRTQEGLTYKKQESQNSLNRDVDSIFRELKAWRRDEAIQQNVPAYFIFNDKELMSIAAGDIVEKSDLLLVKGISNVKFEVYGDDIYEVLKPFIKEKLLLIDKNTGEVIEEPITPKAERIKAFMEYRSDQARKRKLKPLPEISMEQIKEFPFRKNGIMYVSDFLNYFNDVRDKKLYRALKYSDISDWLVLNGYIIENIGRLGNKVRIVTENGLKNGFENEDRLSTNGPYTVLLCNFEAQLLIVNNIHNIIANGNKHEEIIKVSIDEPEPKQKRSPYAISSDADDSSSRAKGKLVETNCKKCILYRNENCFGKDSICEDFRNAVDISADELSMWPKEMSGPYGTLHTYR